VREWMTLIAGTAALIALAWYWGGADCEPIRIARVIELGGCR